MSTTKHALQIAVMAHLLVSPVRAAQFVPLSDFPQGNFYSLASSISFSRCLQPDARHLDPVPQLFPVGCTGSHLTVAHHGDHVVARVPAMIAAMFSGEKNSAGEIVPAFIWTKPSVACWLP